MPTRPSPYINGDDEYMSMKEIARTKVTVGQLMDCARQLAGSPEDQAESPNPEYGRALVELIVDAAGLSAKAAREIAEYLKIDIGKEVE
jgi:hypothetical protein